VVILKTVLAEFVLQFYLLERFAQEGELRAVEILIGFVGDVAGLLAEEAGEFVGLLLCFGVLFFQGGFQGGYFLADFEEFALAGVEVVLGELAEDVVADELDEIVYLFAALGVLVAEGVEDDRAVYVYVFAEGVVLQGVAGVDHGGGGVLLLLFGLLAEEGLVVVEVLEGGLYPCVDFVLQQFDHFAVQRHAFSPFAVPVLEHLVVGLLLFEGHLHQHPHLLELHLVLPPAPFRQGCEGLVQESPVFPLLLEYLPLLLLLLASEIRPQLLHVPVELGLVGQFAVASGAVGVGAGEGGEGLLEGGEGGGRGGFAVRLRFWAGGAVGLDLCLFWCFGGGEQLDGRVAGEVVPDLHLLEGGTICYYVPVLSGGDWGVDVSAARVSIRAVLLRRQSVVVVVSVVITEGVVPLCEVEVLFPLVFGQRVEFLGESDLHAWRDVQCVFVGAGRLCVVIHNIWVIGY
jgi:hypothetical protein